MEDQEDKSISIVGTIVGIAIIGAIICGILECFGVNTGVIGGVFALITVLPISLYIVHIIIQKLKGGS